MNNTINKYKDAVSIAEGILYAIKSGKDMGEKGKQTAKKMYEFDVMYNNYINLYESKV